MLGGIFFRTAACIFFGHRPARTKRNCPTFPSVEEGLFSRVGVSFILFYFFFPTNKRKEKVKVFENCRVILRGKHIT